MICLHLFGSYGRIGLKDLRACYHSLNNSSGINYKYICFHGHFSLFDLVFGYNFFFTHI